MYILYFNTGYVAVKGKERTDRLAGTAVISDGRAIDHADVLQALSDEGIQLKTVIQTLWKD
jgi:hypothetical protein